MKNLMSKQLISVPMALAVYGVLTASPAHAQTITFNTGGDLLSTRQDSTSPLFGSSLALLSLPHTSTLTEVLKTITGKLTTDDKA